MSDSISLYFNDVLVNPTLPSYMSENEYIASNLHTQDFSVALIGIPDKNNSANTVRNHLYTLFGNFTTIKLRDLGNLKKGKSKSSALKHARSAYLKNASQLKSHP